MNVAFQLVTIIVVGALAFVFGSFYGRQAEQYLVAKALAEYGKLSSASVGLVQSVLSRLKAEYTDAYDDVVTDLSIVKKAL